MNNSSETSMKFNFPTSYLMNSSLVDDTTLNSFLSPRAGSVNIIGKKLHSQSCLSLTEADEKNFPIPIQSLKKINRQKTQAKALLKKKNLKTKAQEQPAPVPKVSKVYPSAVQGKEKKTKPLKSLKEKTENKAKPAQALTDRQTVKINRILRKSAIFETRKKRREEIIKTLESKKKIHKKNLLNKKNSRIRIENFNKFRQEKFTPKAPWGVDERKLVSHEKVLRDIEKQREAQKDSRKNLKLRKTILEKVLDIDSFKPRSSSNPSYMPKEKLKKEPNKKLKEYMKNQRKKDRQAENNKIIETIQRETKRIINLKQLNNKKSPKKTQKNNSKIRPKKISFHETEDEIAKIYADKSSEFVFEPDSNLKDQMSEFSEDSMKGNLDMVSAVIKIQYYVRKYLKSKNKKKNPLKSDKKPFYVSHKSDSLPSTTIETAPKSVEMKEEEKYTERIQTDTIRFSSEDNALNDSLSDIQVSRFQSIPVDSEFSIHLDPNSQINSDEDVSLNSKNSKEESEESSKQDTKSQENDEFDEEEIKVALVSRASPVDDKSRDSKIVASQDINEISERIIQQVILDCLGVETAVKKPISIEKDPIPYIDQIVFHAPQKDFKQNLAKPIRKNPLEILAKIQNSSEIFVNTFDSFSVPAVIPLSVYNEIESYKTYSELEVEEPQKIHNRLIFDSCNEQLHFFRPYGTLGHPLPWSSCQRSVSKSNINIFKVIPKVARKIEVLSQFQAGKIIDYSSDAFQSKPQEYFNNIREEKIGVLILQDIKSDEHGWIDYEYQEISATIDISGYILSDLITETIQLI